MGIIVSKESLRPYHSISTVDETEFHSINMELGQTNGMSVGTSPPRFFSKLVDLLSKCFSIV